MPVVVGEGIDAGSSLKELRQEVYARGFDDLDNEEGEPRVNRWINQSAREIYDYAPWPFLEGTVSDTAPLVISQLGHVLSLADETAGRQIGYIDRAEIAAIDPDFNEEGAATNWYREGDTIKVWPADEESTFLVRYVLAPEDLSEDAETPLVPAPYQDLIVDGAVVRAYKNRDNFEAAQFVRQEWERGIKQMAHALLRPNYDNARSVIRTGEPRDYL